MCVHVLYCTVPFCCKNRTGSLRSSARSLPPFSTHKRPFNGVSTEPQNAQFVVRLTANARSSLVESPPLRQRPFVSRQPLHLLRLLHLLQTRAKAVAQAGTTKVGLKSGDASSHNPLALDLCTNWRMGTLTTREAPSYEAGKSRVFVLSLQTSLDAGM